MLYASVDTYPKRALPNSPRWWRALFAWFMPRVIQRLDCPLISCHPQPGWGLTRLLYQTRFCAESGVGSGAA